MLVGKGKGYLAPIAEDQVRHRMRLTLADWSVCSKLHRQKLGRHFAMFVRKMKLRMSTSHLFIVIIQMKNSTNIFDQNGMRLQKGLTLPVKVLPKKLLCSQYGNIIPITVIYYGNWIDKVAE